MRKISHALVLASAIVLPSVMIASSASAEEAAAAAPTPEHTLTANVGVFSQYIYRGLIQTNEKPALQGGFDYVHSSGFYAGVWGSNVSWISDAAPGVSASLELDTYLGFKNAFGGGDFNYDVGFLRYNYPGNYSLAPAGYVKPDTNEIYGAIGYKWFTLKYSHAISDIFGFANSKNTDYLDLSANFEVMDKLTLGLHAGKQKFHGDVAGVSNDSLFTYDDYKVSLTKAINDYSVGVAFTGTNAKAANYTNAFGKNMGRSEATVFVSRTF